MGVRHGVLWMRRGAVKGCGVVAHCACGLTPHRGPHIVTLLGCVCLVWVAKGSRVGWIR